MTSPALLTSDELQDAAFYLLTCSSAERFVRMAKCISDRLQLSAQLRGNPLLTISLLDRARTLWKIVLSVPRRDIAEFELAVLLPLLARTASPEVDNLLIALGLVERPNTAWLSALARRLHSERASNQYLAWHHEFFQMNNPVRNSAGSHYVSLAEPKVSISCPVTISSQQDGSFSLAA